MKCKYCKKKKNPRIDAVTCGDKECRKKYNRDYNKLEKVITYNRNFQRVSQMALRELGRRHRKEFREIRNKLLEKEK